MEKELNIAAILKDKSKGLKLWSDTFGELVLAEINKDKYYPINLTNKNGLFVRLTKEGYYHVDKKGLLPCIVPSKEMRDWSKFAWKKGDVLTDEERFVVFKGFNTDDYTEFSAPFEYEDDAYRQGLWFVTNDFRKVSDNIAQEVIKKIENHYGGKLNLSTLEIEQPKQEFNDGDIVYLNTKNGLQYVFAYDANKEMATSYIVAYCITLEEFAHIETQWICSDNMITKIRLATDSEKQQLFSALEKEGKAWDAEKKMLVDLPKKCELKPMDWCLMRFRHRVWNLCQFAFINKSLLDNPVAVGGNIYEECIPYNDQTKHLLGTTDEWKGGEK